jgi:hypothetical protein
VNAFGPCEEGASSDRRPVPVPAPTGWRCSFGECKCEWAGLANAYTSDATLFRPLRWSSGACHLVVPPEWDIDDNAGILDSITTDDSPKSASTARPDRVTRTLICQQIGLVESEP